MNQEENPPVMNVGMCVDRFRTVNYDDPTWTRAAGEHNEC
jgi:hypothetical protein